MILLVGLLLIVCYAVVWRWPWAGCGFLVVGAIPYYAILHALRIEPSAALTGAALGGTGLVACGRLLSRQTRFKLPTTQLMLFWGFVAIWYLRWFQDPPPPSMLEGVEQFAVRARVFMVAFAIAPFLSALSLQDAGELRQLLRAIAGVGMVSLAIAAAYWVTGQPHLGAAWSNKWEPIPNLTGIIFSFDLGAGCLAVLALSPLTPRPPRWLLIGMVVLTLAIQLKVGQRGPFVFLLATLLLYAISQSPNRLTKLGLAVGAATAFLVALTQSDGTDTSRALDASRYSAEGNVDRLTLLSLASDWVGERPLVGWGGSLVGRPAGDEAWTYLHVSFGDALLETGLLGAVPYWALCWLIVAGFRKYYNARIGDLTVAGAVAPLFAYTFLESQVSGHISASKHMWCFMGVAAALPWLSTDRSEGEAPSHGS